MKKKCKGLFDFAEYIKELRNSGEIMERGGIERYEKNAGCLQENIRECEFYTYYLRFFEPVEYNIPSGLEDDFDWDLLLQLTAGSFSSNYDIIDGELFITVESKKNDNEKPTIISKKVSGLSPFQILRMFEIYISELINLSSLIYDLDDEKDMKWKFESIFINNNPAPKDESSYIKMCSYIEPNPEGLDILSDRFDRIEKYKLMVDRLKKSKSNFEDIFISNDSNKHLKTN